MSEENLKEKIIIDNFIKNSIPIDENNTDKQCQNLEKFVEKYNDKIDYKYLLDKEKNQLTKNEVTDFTIRNFQSNIFEENSSIISTTIKSNMYKTEKKYNKLFIFLITVNASLSYLFIGFNIGVTDTLQDNFKALYNWTDAEEKYYLSLINSLLSLGALCGALFLSPILLKKGRRFSIFVGNFIGLFGCALLNILLEELMIIGRFFIGVTIGLLTTCVGIYVKEYVPYEIIGMCGSIYELNFSIGIFFSYFLGLNLPTNEEIKINPNNNWWRFMLTAPAVFLVFSNLIFFFHFKKETPFFLYINKKDYTNSEKALKEIYYQNSDIIKILKDYNNLSENREADIKFMDLFTKKYKKRFLVGLMLLFTQQACGIDGFLMYSNSLFKQSVKDDKTASLLTNCSGLFLIFSGITTLLIIEKLGRKLILIIGQIIMIFLLLLLAYFYFIEKFEFVIYLLIGYIYVNGVSLSPVSFIYAADVLPEVGMGICMALNNICSFIITEFFMYAMSSCLGTYGLMLIFAFFILLNLFSTIFFLKETKDLSSDEIDKMYTPTKIEPFLNN